MGNRKFLIAGNWKMNPAPAGAFDPGSAYQMRTDVDVVVFPTFLDLPKCIDAKILCGPQWGHPEESGAFTGDVSMKMSSELGCRYALCGHSDRREQHEESSEYVAAQAVAALELGMHPIVCIGENLDQRRAGEAEAVVAAQLAPLPLESDITLAYEPIWAISRGDPNCPAATPDDAETMHAFIRSQLPEDRREETRILYGGSMKPENAKELLSLENVDGGLIGGASLKPDAFAEVIFIAEEL